MPGDIDPGYARCARCGSSRPSGLMTEGHCMDLAWCEAVASDEVGILRAQLAEARHFSKMTLDHAAGEGVRQEAAVAKEREECALLVLREGIKAKDAQEGVWLGDVADAIRARR